MGVETNSYDIPVLVLGDTFYEWFTLTNNEIINKLNRLEVYSVVNAGGSAGDGISAGTDSTGALHIEIGATVEKDITFNGNVTVNGSTTTINSTDFSIDDYNLVLGATSPTSSDPDIMDNSGGASGGGLIIKGASSDKEFLWKYNNAAFNISENLSFAAGKSILSAGDGVRIATGVSGGASGSDAPKGLRFGFKTGTTGGGAGNDTVISVVNTDIATGYSADAISIDDDGMVSIVNGANKITIDQAAHGLSFGTPVYMNSNGNYTKALAGGGSYRATAEVVGVVSKVYSANRFEISMSGEIVGDFSPVTVDGGKLLAGQAYFVSPTSSGKIDGVKPSSQGQIQKTVLIGLTSDRAVVKNFIGGDVTQIEQASAALVSNKIQITQDGHGFTSGDAIRVRDTTPTFSKAEAVDGRDEVIGIVESVGVGGNTSSFNLVLSGRIEFPNDVIDSSVIGETFFVHPDNTVAPNIISTTGLESTPFVPGDISKPVFVSTGNRSAIITNLRGFEFSDLEGSTAESDVPVGSVVAWAGSAASIPNGYLLCDGQLLNTNDTRFQDLKVAIGTQFNQTGDDSDLVFRVPDLTARFIVGQDGGSKYTLGDVGGEDETVLTTEQMPSHNHNYFFGPDSTGGGGFSNQDPAQGSNFRATSDTGGGLPHENRPPFFALCWIIRAEGINSLPDGTQILGGDTEFVTVGTPSHDDVDASGVLETQFLVGSHTSSVNGHIKSEEFVVDKNDLAEAGTNGIFPDQIREVTVKFIAANTVASRVRMLLYYKFPDGETRKVCEIDDPAGTERLTLALPVNSEQTELVFRLGRSASHSGASITELYITGVRQVADNALIRLKKSYGSRKNVLLNGNFSFWERGATTDVADTATADFYLADRWKRTSNGMTTLEVTRKAFDLTQTTVPDFPQYHIQVKGTDSSTLAVNDFCALEQRVEDYRTYANKNVSISFWAKGSVGGDCFLGFKRFSDASEEFFKVSPFTVSTEWKKYIFRTRLPAISFGATNIENSYLALAFHTAVKNGFRANDSITADGTAIDYNYAGTLNLAQVQLEEGSRATPFEHLSVGEELPLLQRYYWRDDSLTLFHTDPNTNTADACIFPVTMRAAPAEAKIRGGLVGFEGAGTAIVTKSIGVTGIVNPGKRSYAWERSGSTSTGDTTVVGWDADAEL